ncbi:NADPH:quinone oxidoreductase [Planobispora takensis]|uniref:NADPH:quinone oxidoreductase n=1 Tax=Planobispora takensis TaxID=1367882 RepID=A0A8J3WRV1_9ACTN|nr:NADPH:quinone oxidoreductase [Planobispora takensis]
MVGVSEAEKPAIKDDELLVKVYATTVNRTDCALRAAKPFFWRLSTGLVRPKARIIGTEFAGEIEAVGSGVTSFGVGDRVFGYNDRGFGAHAQYMAIHRDGMLAAMPAGLTYEEAAPATEGAQYALAMIRTAKVRSGQDVLVYGATGAIGSAAVQLLKSLGAVVTAVCGAKDVELVAGLGADRVVDYTARDFTKDEQEYDVVIDAVGKSTFGRCRRLLRPRGIYVSSELGPLAQNLFLVLLTPVLRGRRVVFPFPRNGPAMARHFKELIESGRFTPVIDRRYPLEEIVEAHRYVETGQKTGNVVIVVDHSE